MKGAEPQRLFVIQSHQRQKPMTIPLSRLPGELNLSQ